MKRFKFRLQALLNYKAYLEQVARQEMAAAVAEVNQCRQQIESLTQERTAAFETLDQLVARGITAGAFQTHQGFIAATQQMIEDGINQMAALERQVDEKREQLKQRTIDKKAMERLRTMQQQAHALEMNRETQKELDEVASLQKARQRTVGEASNG